jgi:hypothetical protein
MLEQTAEMTLILQNLINRTPTAIAGAPIIQVVGADEGLDDGYVGDTEPLPANIHEVW